ncbi:Gfo/Idh/MocA family oxidoreductase [uncultured Subdoligranulum sp.]|uniref:Gfo/Idh/MocA family protein n=1 Tax=uncultured Subdoligranulum sp. TaxID=512298 RepID=UPI0025F8DDCB|nr:Gfo/Idh/MocA family oxidoreductase [uncultured Subdoligranulum sp.]
MKLGILGAGFIAHVMADTVRRMQAAGHGEVELYAVAAREEDRARDFARQYGMPCAFGSYEAMLQDPAVDFVYIATPHSHHYRHIRLCVDHGKPVLCEKAFTVNARQADDVLRRARARGVLVTEAIWTRYQPMRRMLDEVLQSGVIGRPQLLTANLGYAMTQNRRIVDPALAGGALLDVGVYTLNFAEMVFGRADGVQGLCTKHETGVDLTDSITLTWADGRAAHLTAAANAVTDRYGAVYGTDGYLLVENINNPQKITVFDGHNRPVRELPCPPQLTGYEYELLETVRCLEQGLVECPSMPHAETVHMMEVMDHLRAQMGIVYPCEAVDA